MERIDITNWKEEYITNELFSKDIGGWLNKLLEQNKFVDIVKVVKIDIIENIGIRFLVIVKVRNESKLKTV